MVGALSDAQAEQDEAERSQHVRATTLNPDDHSNLFFDQRPGRLE